MQLQVNNFENGLEHHLYVKNFRLYGIVVSSFVAGEILAEGTLLNHHSFWEFVIRHRIPDCQFDE